MLFSFVPQSKTVNKAPTITVENDLNVNVPQTGIQTYGSTTRTVEMGKTLKLAVVKVPADTSDNYKITSTSTLYAKWTANQYNVIYDSNGGTGSMNNSTHVYDENKALSRNLYSKSGYIFVGWSKTKNGTVDYEDGQDVKRSRTGLGRELLLL